MHLWLSEFSYEIAYTNNRIIIKIENNIDTDLSKVLIFLLFFFSSSSFPYLILLNLISTYYAKISKGQKYTINDSAIDNSFKPSRMPLGRKIKMDIDQSLFEQYPLDMDVIVQSDPYQ